MESNLTRTKKVMFLMAMILVLNMQARENVEFYDGVKNQDDIVSITVRTEVVTKDAETDHQEKTSKETYIALEDNKYLVEETETVEDVPVHAETIEQLAAMINDGTIRTFNQFVAACKNFPELVEIAHKFVKENITNNVIALKKFRSITSSTAKKLIFDLVMKVKDKQKLWNLFSN